MDPWAVLERLPEKQLENLELILADFQNSKTTLNEIYHVGFDNLTEKYFTENFKKHHFATNYTEALAVSQSRTDTRRNTVLCGFQRNSFMIADIDEFLGAFEGSLKDEKVKKYFEIHGQENIYNNIVTAFYEFMEKYNNESGIEENVQ